MPSGTSLSTSTAQDGEWTPARPPLTRRRQAEGLIAAHRRSGLDSVDHAVISGHNTRPRVGVELAHLVVVSRSPRPLRSAWGCERQRDAAASSQERVRVRREGRRSLRTILDRLVGRAADACFAGAKRARGASEHGRVVVVRSASALGAGTDARSSRKARARRASADTSGVGQRLAFRSDFRAHALVRSV